MTPLNPKEIREKYPKAVKALEDYCIKDMPPPSYSIITNEQIANIAISTHRGLYEFFDENELYIHVGRWKDSFGWGIGDVKHGFDSRSGCTEASREERKWAEKEAFEAAFEDLEKKLTNE